MQEGKPPRAAQVNDMMLDGFDQNEKKMLESLLSRLIENLRRHRG